ncbi:MAG: universal stress protein [Aeromicrobium erythreum]
MPTIVTGYRDTPESQAALDWAVAYARREHARLVVVATPSGGGAVGVSPEQEIDLLRDRLTSEAVEHTIVHLDGERPAADEILDRAEGVDADLVVIGQRRRSPVGKVLLGSTSQRIILEAPCPVVAVKAPD